MHRPALLSACLVLIPAVLLGSPEEEFSLRAAPIEVGDDWEVHTSTRVEDDPRVNPRKILQTGGEYTETSAEVRYTILAQDEEGRIQLETRQKPQTVAARIGGQLTEETSEEKTETRWGLPEEMLPGEIGPASLLARERTRRGDTWDCEATLPVGGMAPVRVRLRYQVASARKQGQTTILRITCAGSGAAEAEDGSRIDVSIQGVLHVDPSQVDRPRKAVMVYRVKISGGEQPVVATRTTVRLETTKRS